MGCGAVGDVGKGSHAFFQLKIFVKCNPGKTQISTQINFTELFELIQHHFNERFSSLTQISDLSFPEDHREQLGWDRGLRLFC